MITYTEKTKKDAITFTVIAFGETNTLLQTLRKTLSTAHLESVGVDSDAGLGVEGGQFTLKGAGHWGTASNPSPSAVPQ